MRTKAVRSARTVSILCVLLTAAGLTGGPSSPSAAPSGAVSLPAPDSRARLGSLDPRFAAAALAFRNKDCGAAAQELAELAGGSGEPARLARLVSGLHAYACSDPARAANLLASSGSATDPLEDWRLFALAEVSRQLGHIPLAHDSLAQLLADYRQSPLWSRALVTAALRSRDDGDLAGALELVRWSREQEGLSNDAIGQLEGLAWQLANQRGDRALATTAARRLLVHAPTVADELDVIESFRPSVGRLAWAAILSSEELTQRAEALMEAGLPGAATLAYEAVAPADRTLEWRLASARALTSDRRPAEALARLAGARPADASERSRVLYEQAQAETALSFQPTGRKRAAVAERARRAAAARARWFELARLDGADAEARTQALRRVAQTFDGEKDLPGALTYLRALRSLAPSDTSGAAFLWTAGWKQFAAGRLPVAISTWATLTDLYPESREARAGLYWTARAQERMGRREQAQALFQDLAASETTDFYRRHALARLGPTAASLPSAKSPGTDPWPAEPLLERARWLTDLGLDALAMDEVSLLGDAPDFAARNALVGLTLSRQGRRRDSIPYLRRAFPHLGGAQQTRVPLEALRLYYPLQFSREVADLARQAGVEPMLVYGIIRQESAFDLTALSHAGARGLMQLMPGTGRETAKRLGLPFSVARLEEPAFNLTLGTTYFSDVMDLFGGREELALAGYNGGPYRIQRLWRQAGPGAEVDSFLEGLSIEESRTYVKRVLLFAESYRQLYGDELRGAASSGPAAP